MSGARAAPRFRVMIEFGHGSHSGRQRAHNEDTYEANAGLGLWLVADGMGGHAHGEVASALARDTISAAVRAGKSLVEAIRDADSAIIARGSEADLRRDRLPMGTTVAALRLSAGAYRIAWVGDSRVYLASDTLQQLSTDHSVVRRMVDGGLLSEDEARHHPRRNEITQALGITPASALRVASLEGSVRPGTQFLLCSDGLSDELTAAEIAAIVLRPDLGAQECVDQLLAAALEAGGRDNITAVLVRIGLGSA